MFRLVSSGILLLVSCMIAAAPDASKDNASSWTHWRGPSGQGYVNDDRVPLTWSETENLLWKTKLPGRGNSSPIVYGGRVFLTTSSDGGAVRTVVCVRADDGKILWQQVAAKDVPEEASHGWNGHASPSCATDGTHVWAFFGTPGLFCYDIDGKLAWKKAFGKFISKAGWGTAASPFLYRDLVILNCDNDGGPGAAPQALVALDKKTGDVRWTTPRNQGRGFSTPRLMTMPGGRVDLVLNGPAGVWGYDPETGKERWRCRRTSPDEKEKFGEALPVDDGERMFVVSGRAGPFQIVKLPGEGDITKSHVVHTGQRRGHRDVSSPIVWQGRVYLIDNKGALTSYDLKTGKELYNESVSNRKKAPLASLASPIAIQGKLLWVMEEGTTLVVEPGARPRIVARNKLPGEKLDFGASPAVVDGRLYLRSQSYLYCIGKK